MIMDMIIQAIYSIPGAFVDCVSLGVIYRTYKKYKVYISYKNY